MGNKLPILISPDTLNSIQKEANFNEKFRLLEANFGPAQEEFNKGHIKNAIFFDTLNSVESTKMYPRGYPTPQAFKEYCENLGISDKHHIILYDRSQYGFFASSRVWLMLRVFGHEKVSLVSGGLNGWKKHNFELSTDTVNFPKAVFKVKENNWLIRNYDDMIKILEAKQEQIIDARPREEFNKENTLLGQNNIPTSKNVPYPELFDSATGTIKDNNQLLELFKKADVDLARPTIAYCNSSVTASSVVLAAYLLGYEKIPIYKGSWTEYSQKKEEELSKA